MSPLQKKKVGQNSITYNFHKALTSCPTLEMDTKTASTWWDIFPGWWRDNGECCLNPSTNINSPLLRTSNLRSRWHTAKPRVPTAIPISLSIAPSESRIYGRRGPLAIDENIYCVAFWARGCDWLIPSPRWTIYMFQFADGSNHNVDRGLLTTLARFSSLPAAENWYFILIVAQRLANLNCPHSDSFIPNISMCSTAWGW